MKLEKVIINGTEYYQWVVLGTYPKFLNTVGDLFSNWLDIRKEKQKLLEQVTLFNSYVKTTNTLSQQ